MSITSNNTAISHREVGLVSLPSILLVSIIFLSFVGLSPVILVGEDTTVNATTPEGDALRQVAFVVVFAGVCFDSAVKAQIRSLFKVPFGIGLVLVWCWLSMIWAIEPSIAVRRTILTTIIILSV